MYAGEGYGRFTHRCPSGNIGGYVITCFSTLPPPSVLLPHDNAEPMPLEWRERALNKQPSGLSYLSRPLTQPWSNFAPSQHFDQCIYTGDSNKAMTFAENSVDLSYSWAQYFTISPSFLSSSSLRGSKISFSDIVQDLLPLLCHWCWVGGFEGSAFTQNVLYTLSTELS